MVVFEGRSLPRKSEKSEKSAYEFPIKFPFEGPAGAIEPGARRAVWSPHWAGDPEVPHHLGSLTRPFGALEHLERWWLAQFCRHTGLA